MRRNTLMLMVLIIITACSQGKDSVKRIQADYCSVIKVEKEQVNLLVDQFDKFALSQEMNMDKSNPTSVEYTDKTKSTIIVLRNYFGPHGSITSLYEIAEQPNSLLEESFKQFILGDISKQFEVTPCEEVEGLSTPEIISN